MIQEVEDIKNRFLKEAPLLEEAQKRKYIEVTGRYGGVAAFLDSLVSFEIDSPDDPRLPGVYDFYSGFFPLVNELETFEGFRKSLALNMSSEFLERLSPFNNRFILLKSPEGRLIGGVNFCIFSMPGDVAARFSTAATANIIYIFVEKEYRKLGVAGRLLELMERDIESWLRGIGCNNCGKVLITCEQNAPELMSGKEYFGDNLVSGIDQCDRLLWWHRKGYRRLTFNYTQPPLTPGGNPCINLTLNIKSEGWECVHGGLLYEHIRRYFEVSVFKSSLPESDPYIDKLFKYLLSTPCISTCGGEEYYRELKKECYGGACGPVTSLFPEP